MVYAIVSKTIGRKALRVRVPLSAPTMEYPNCNAPWEELDYAVEVLRQDNPEFPLFEALFENPITPHSIEELFKNGWQIRTSSFVKYGECDSAGKEITLNGNLTPLARDVTICHEITHAHYPDSCREPNELYNLCKADHLQREFVTEWEARRLRANPRILRAIAGQLGGTSDKDYSFQPIIYDRATFLAFGLHDYNIDRIPKRLPRALRNIPLLMDMPEITHLKDWEKTIHNR